MKDYISLWNVTADVKRYLEDWFIKSEARNDELELIQKPT